jgi:hypothetical protein
MELRTKRSMADPKSVVVATKTSHSIGGSAAFAHGPWDGMERIEVKVRGKERANFGVWQENAGKRR